LKRPHRVVELHPLATLYNYLRQCGWANALRHTNSIKKSSGRTKRDSFMHFSPCFRCPCRCPPGAAPPSIPAHRLREARRVGHPDDGRLCGSAATARRLGMGISASGGRLGHRCVYLFDRHLPLSAYHPPHWAALMVMQLGAGLSFAYSEFN